MGLIKKYHYVIPVGTILKLHKKLLLFVKIIFGAIYDKTETSSVTNNCILSIILK